MVVRAPGDPFFDSIGTWEDGFSSSPLHRRLQLGCENCHLCSTVHSTPIYQPFPIEYCTQYARNFCGRVYVTRQHSSPRNGLGRERERELPCIQPFTTRRSRPGYPWKWLNRHVRARPFETSGQGNNLSTLRSELRCDSCPTGLVRFRCYDVREATSHC